MSDLRFQKLTPTSNVDLNVYEEGFEFIFSNDDIRNIQSIFIDDPIGSYDDMNALGFADLIRSLLENSKCQIIMSTHDETIFKILQRKLDNRYYSSCFIELPYGNGIKWEI